MSEHIDIANNLINFIKKMSVSTNVFIGEVMAVNLEERTCSIKQVTGVANDSIDYKSEDEKNQNSEYFDFVNQALLHEDVALMSGGSVDDGILFIPKIGSQVTVLTNQRQQAFIIQYSALDNMTIVPLVDYSITIADSILTMNAESLEVTIADGTTMLVDDKFFVTTKNGVNIEADTDLLLKNEAGSEMTLSSDISMKSSDGSEVTLDTGFDLKASLGAEISGGAKVSIKNSAGSLLAILNQIVLCLSDIATGVCAAPGSPIVAPTLAADIAQLTTKITLTIE